MGALGYEQSAVRHVLQALVAASGRLRDNGGREEGKTSSQSSSPSFPRSLSTPSWEFDAIPIEKTPHVFALEDRGEARELVQAGMAALSDPPEPEEIEDWGWHKLELDGDKLLDVLLLSRSGIRHPRPKS